MAKISLQTMVHRVRRRVPGRNNCLVFLLPKKLKKSSLLQSVHCNSLRCQSTPDSEASGIPSVCPLSTHINPSPSSRLRTPPETTVLCHHQHQLVMDAGKSVRNLRILSSSTFTPLSIQNPICPHAHMLHPRLCLMTYFLDLV